LKFNSFFIENLYHARHSIHSLKSHGDLVTQQTMYPAQPDSPDFTLAADITSPSQTALVFVDLTGLLAAPNTLTIRQDDYDTTPETVYYAAGPVGTTLTVQRGYGGTTAKTFTAGALACRAHTAWDLNTVQYNIDDLVSLISGLAVDSAVFHKATAGEINALTLKASPAGTDVLVIEDSAGSTFDKKKITISTLPFQTVLTNPVTGPGSGATVGHIAIMNNTTGTLIADGGVAIPTVPAFETDPTNIKINGTQALGSSGKLPNSDHVHPTDTSRQAVLTYPVTGLTSSFASDHVITGTGTGDQVQDSGMVLSTIVIGPASATDGHLTVFDGGSGKLVKDGGVPLTVADLSSTAETVGGSAAVGSALTAARSDHKHAITNPALDTLAPPTNITTLDVSVTAHGLCPRLDNNTAHFLRGDGDWSTPPINTGDVVGPASAVDGDIVLFSTTTGKLVKDSNITIVTTLGSTDTTIPTSKAVLTAISSPAVDETARIMAMIGM
jgi:hypothetical protein